MVPMLLLLPMYAYSEHALLLLLFRWEIMFSTILSSAGQMHHQLSELVVLARRSVWHRDRFAGTLCTEQYGPDSSFFNPSLFFSSYVHMWDMTRYALNCFRRLCKI